MKFTNFHERMQHPQIKLIPESLWKNYGFYFDEFPDDLLPLMQAGDTVTLLQEIQVFNLKQSTEKIKLAWIVIALSHSGLNVDTLQEIANRFNLSDSDLLEVAATWGNIEFFQSLLIKYEQQNLLQSIIAAKEYRLFSWAARHGHLDIINYLERKIDPHNLQEMIEGCYFDAFCYAAERGHFVHCEAPRREN